MIAGLSTSAFTTFHVILSLIGIFAGLVVLASLIGNKWRNGWNILFLATTVATSVTGFFFHSVKIGPPHVVGVISIVVLAIALYALYGRRLSGIWSKIYVGTAIFALYLNVFVGVVQAFQKLSFLNQFAPTQKEPPFLVAQAIVLLIFIWLGWKAINRVITPSPLAEKVAHSAG
jgi:hypothetical protein